MSTTFAGTASPAALRPRKATAADLPDVADTLALAFYDDPVVTWIIDDGPRRRQLLPDFFGAIAESYLVYEETYSVDEGYRGGRLGAARSRGRRGARSQCSARRSEEYAERLFEILGLMEENHPVEPHHYLFLLATRPEWQGRGLGSSLMAPVLQRAIGTACRRISRPRASATSSSTSGTASK